MANNKYGLIVSDRVLDHGKAFTAEEVKAVADFTDNHMILHFLVEENDRANEGGCL